LKKQTLSEVEVERAVAAAYAFVREQAGASLVANATPHAFIDDVIGLDDYRRFMRCPDTETLAAYAEDALPLEDALRVAAHESRCPVCRSDVMELRGVVRQEMAQLLAMMPTWVTPFVGREALRESLNATLASGDRCHPSGGGNRPRRAAASGTQRTAGRAVGGVPQRQTRPARSRRRARFLSSRPSGCRVDGRNV
jgi:hypothetical protein